MRGGRVAYSRQSWRNKDKGTPLNADRLNHIEAGVEAASRAYRVWGALRELPVETVDVAGEVERVEGDLMPAEAYTDRDDSAFIGLFSRISDAADGNGPEAVDAGTGRVVQVITMQGSGLGVLVVPHGRPVSVLICAPHPVFDSGTPGIAYALWQAAGEGAALLVAGTHRGDATGENPADAARNPRHPVSRVCAYFSARGVPIFEQHGFGDDSAPGVDAFVSGGATGDQPCSVRLRHVLSEMGWNTPGPDDEPVGVLRGTTNPHGVAARDMGAGFVHVELSKSVRETPLKRFVRAVVDTGALDGAFTPAGSFPPAIGSVNAAGTSLTFARADHTHRLTQNTPKDGDFVVRRHGGWRSITIDEARQVLGIPAP